MAHDPKALLKELIRRDQHATSRLRAQPPGTPPPDYPFLRDLFDLQREFIFHTAKRKTLLCSRRAGKTYAAIGYLLKECMDNPGVVCVYIALTRLRAKQLVFNELRRFNQRYRLGIEFNLNELTATFPNSSQIIMTGATDASDIEKLRGGKYALVIVDEAQSFGSFIDAMIDEVIEPALIDLDGTLCLLGTPGAAAAGFFYDATTTAPRKAQADEDEPSEAALDGELDVIPWQNFSWTIRENRALVRQRGAEAIERYLKQLRARKGWTEQHPIYLREWCAQWVRSDDDLVYRFDAKRNTFRDLPTQSPAGKPLQWEYVLGIDLGYNDAFTVSVLAFTKQLPTVYLVDWFGQSKLIPAQWAEIIGGFVARYAPVAVVADAGALGKAIVEELKTRYSLPIKPAEKSKKIAYIDLLNGDLISSRLMLKHGAPHIDEMRLLQWESDSNRTREDPSYSNDHCFVAGTMITTADGDKAIEDITLNTLVLTRKGWRPVTAAGVTGVADIYRLVLEDGRELLGTGNHPVMTQDGWKRLDAVQQTDTLYACRKDIRETLEPDPEKPIKSTCKGSSPTGQSGNVTTALYRPVTTFITKTVTSATTLLKTWSALLQAPTCPSTCADQKPWPVTEKTLSALLQLRQLGTALLKGSSGTSRTHKTCGRTNPCKTACAPCAEERFRHAQGAQQSAEPTALQSVAEKAALTISKLHARNVGRSSNTTSTTRTVDVVPIRVRRLETTGYAQRVYNLTVDDTHEYFANGVLVHNCDSLLYSWRECRHWLPQHKDVLDAFGLPVGADPLDQLSAREANTRHNPATKDWAAQDGVDAGFPSVRTPRSVGLLQDLEDPVAVFVGGSDDGWLQ